jgi:predicted ribosome quality control (RQC) complex YloA/Tae2 family protein
MQNAPVSIQKTNENGRNIIQRINFLFFFFFEDLKSFLKNIDTLFTSINNRQLDRLFSMRDSYKFVDRLIHCFQQKKLAIERNRLQQKEFEEKASNSLKEEQQLKEKLNLLISYTKQLKEQVRSFVLKNFIPFFGSGSERNFGEKMSKSTHQYYGRNQYIIKILFFF